MHTYMDLPQDMSVHFALMSCRVSWAWHNWVAEVSPAHNRQHFFEVTQILRLAKFWAWEQACSKFVSWDSFWPGSVSRARKCSTRASPPTTPHTPPTLADIWSRQRTWIRTSCRRELKRTKKSSTLRHRPPSSVARRKQIRQRGICPYVKSKLLNLSPLPHKKVGIVYGCMKLQIWALYPTKTMVLRGFRFEPSTPRTYLHYGMF